MRLVRLFSRQTLDGWSYCGGDYNHHDDVDVDVDVDVDLDVDLDGWSYRGGIMIIMAMMLLMLNMLKMAIDVAWNC